MDLWKDGGCHRNLMDFMSWSKYFVLFENSKHFPCHREKICPKKAESSVSF